MIDATNIDISQLALEQLATMTKYELVEQLTVSDSIDYCIRAVSLSLQHHNINNTDLLFIRKALIKTVEVLREIILIEYKTLSNFKRQTSPRHLKQYTIMITNSKRVETLQDMLLLARDCFRIRLTLLDQLKLHSVYDDTSNDKSSPEAV